MGEVYPATHRNGSRVAIKILHPHRRRSPPCCLDLRWNRFLGKPRPLVVLVAEGLFAALLLAISALFWWQGSSSSSDPEAPRPGPLARLPLPLPVSLPAVGLRVSAFTLAYTGLFLGLMSGLLGVGGGVLLLPLLIHGYGFSIRAATGTSILILLTSSCVGTFLHALRGNVRLEVVLPPLVASSLSAQMLDLDCIADHLAAKDPHHPSGGARQLGQQPERPGSKRLGPARNGAAVERSYAKGCMCVCIDARTVGWCWTETRTLRRRCMAGARPSWRGEG